MDATRATAVIERLIEDDELHKQFSEGVAKLRAAFERGRAAAEPEPKRRSRRLVVTAVGLGVLALVAAMQRAQKRA